MKDTYKESPFLTAALILLCALFILSFSIAVPITVKPLYYMQIGPLHLEEETGYTREEMKQAYSEMLDFCDGFTDEFSTGTLAFSEEGKAHFEDCRSLFILDLTIFGISSSLLLLWLIIRRFVKVRAMKLKGHSPAFWGSISLLSVFLIVGALGSIDFDKAFVIFHQLFFPGKSNWLFDPRYDEIIKILPETVFMNFAIMIIALLAITSACFIICDIVVKKRREKALKRDRD